MNEEVLSLPISTVLVNDRLRDVDVGEVDRLALSIKEVGQITPIEVRQTDEGSYILVAGAHRLAACMRCGLQNVRALLYAGDHTSARLREIDENLYRRELSPFDQSEFIAERREVWEQIYGEVKRGGDRRKKGQIVPLRDAMRRSGFIKETATRFNLHPKAVKRALSRKAHIKPEVWLAIRGTKSADNASFLDKLSGLDFDTQLAVLEYAKDRGCTFEVAFSTMRRQEREDRMPDPHPLLVAIVRGWGKASEAERRLIRDFIKSKSAGDGS